MAVATQNDARPGIDWKKGEENLQSTQVTIIIGKNSVALIELL